MATDGEKWVACQNILRFEELLKGEKDDGKRRALFALIEQERQKLKGAEPPQISRG